MKEVQWVSSSCTSKFFMFVLLLTLINNGSCSGDIVKTLPGFQGPLPFMLETGYIGVEYTELFYYFVESTGKPQIDPLILYLIGGPGCSGLNGVLYQTGPLAFNVTDYSGGLPQLILRGHTWTKSASIIYPDVPVGTGYSYATTQQGYMLSDTITIRHIMKFLRKWLIEHPKFITNRFYIATDSYSGVFAPILAQQILDDNAAGILPNIELIGYISGSPHCNTPSEINAKVPLAHNLALISDKLYETANENCNGWYYDVDPSDATCWESLEPIHECLTDIYESNVVEPDCALVSPKPGDNELSRRALMEAEQGQRFLPKSLRQKSSDQWHCKIFAYLLSHIWANDKSVQEALHVREGTFDRWTRCNLSLIDEYIKDVKSAFPYHKNLTTTGLQILLYTGDHDLVVPHISTEGWVRSLNITVDDSWAPWFVDAQVAGYKVIYSNTGYRLTYATLKGSGHSPTEYYNERCFQMFERWIHFYPV
ncbi:hypothetical protein PIB30_026819 [Stylosanthes scabra]|uniref:Uncharacterized protein n=1 Tax=Stylosanthes scabra TaxID=79078 RepID=A0ABU6Q9Z6_9FABA|nr:hypothetical protein [Stylosanthes scabra]